MTKIPLILINGTLGSGKTTLVKRMLNDPAYAGAFLIENEYASVNIDREAIADEHDDEIYEISGSCICCSTGEELEAALETVVAKGWTKPVILEATGMANSAVLLQRLFLNPKFTDNFQIQQMVLLIDGAEESADELPSNIAIEAKLADVIIINKGDLAGAEAVRLERALQEINTDATIITAVRSEIDLSVLTARPSNAGVAFARVFPEIKDIELEDATYAVLDVTKPMDPDMVRQALRPESFPVGTDLRRAKGFFEDGDGTQWQVEATAKHIELTQLNSPKQHVLVAIGPGITKQALKEALER